MCVYIDRDVNARNLMMFSIFTAFKLCDSNKLETTPNLDLLIHLYVLKILM